MKTPRRSSPWTLSFIVALSLGVVLRLIWIEDMEYKLDEKTMFDFVATAVNGGPWPWLGMKSGVALENPGLSAWVFILIGKLMMILTGEPITPVLLCRGVQLLNIAAFALALAFVRNVIHRDEREPWHWALALAALNPLLILMHRKIWTQSVLSFFTIAFFWMFWRRERSRHAFAWGLVGACLGQIHMSGFFFAAGFALWAFLWDRGRTRWLPWLAGSSLGVVPLLPWISAILKHFREGPGGGSMFHGWGEAIQLRYWVFWLTDGVGLHVGNSLGVRRGNPLLTQLGPFLEEPLLVLRDSGQIIPTYYMAALHVLIVVIAARLWLPAWVRFFKQKKYKSRPDPVTHPTGFAIGAAMISYGGILTAATLLVRRYYLLITFPLEWVWLARLALPRHRAWLALLIAALGLISIQMLYVLHRDAGAPLGDYGPAYRTGIMRED